MVACANLAPNLTHHTFCSLLPTNFPATQLKIAERTFFNNLNYPSPLIGRTFFSPPITGSTPIPHLTFLQQTY